MNMKASDRQEGGSHYKTFAIQPVEFIHKNGIPFIEGNIIKYILRHKQKNGLEDLNKAKHYIDLLIEQEYQPENSKTTEQQKKKRYAKGFPIPKSRKT